MGGRSKGSWAVITCVKLHKRKITNSLRDLSHLPGVNPFFFLFDFELGKHLLWESSEKGKRGRKTKKTWLCGWLWLQQYIVSSGLHLYSRGLGIEHCDWSIVPLLLPILTMQFSLNRKRRIHEWNGYSASDSNSLIFTRSYRSALVITSPTLTSSLVKTSLKN